MGKRLYRSRSNKVIFGVCGGLGEYFSIDPTIVRLICIAASLFGGTGVVVYLVAAFVMPEEDKNGFGSSYGNTGSGDVHTGNDEWKEPVWKEKPVFDSEKSKIILGGALVLIGLVFLVKQLFNFSLVYMGPVILIILGVVLLYRGRGN